MRRRDLIFEAVECGVWHALFRVVGLTPIIGPAMNVLSLLMCRKVVTYSVYIGAIGLQANGLSVPAYFTNINEIPMEFVIQGGK